MRIIWLMSNTVNPKLGILSSRNVLVSYHLEHLVDQVTEFFPRYAIVPILVDLVKDVVDLLPSGIVNTNILGDLHKHLLELASLEETTSVNVHFPERLLHELLHLLRILD